MENNRSAYVKRRIIRTGLICRALVLTIPVISKIMSGLRVDEFKILMLLLLPVSCLYFTLLVKFVIRNKYLLKGAVLDNFYIVLGRSFLLVPTIAEILLILCKSLYGSPGEEILYGSIGLIECGLAIYAGFYLTEIFRPFDPGQERPLPK